MGLKGTLFGAALGFISGGPIGALLGGIIGNYFTGPDAPKREKISNSPDTEKTEFTYSLVILFAVVIKADRITKKSEVLFVKDYLINAFGKANAAEMMSLLKSLLEKEINVASVCAQIKEESSYPFRLELLHLLFKLSVADGELVAEEVSTLHDISGKLGIYTIDFTRIYAMFAQFQSEFRRQGYQRASGRRQQPPRFDELKNAYDVLGIPKGSTEAEVKKAYRTLVKKYHPDKVSHLGPEYVRIANEKFVKIKDAYDRIMEK